MPVCLIFSVPCNKCRRAARDREHTMPTSAINAIKRYTYAIGHKLKVCSAYAGDDKNEPFPTFGELNRLIGSLGPDERLKEFLRLERQRLGRNVVVSGFVLPGTFDKAAWVAAALKVDELLNDLQKPKATSHSNDFSSVQWFGIHYTFSKGLQAECIKVLWEAWGQGGHSLSEQTIADKTGSANDRFRIFHVFNPTDRDGNRKPHPAWKKMIQPAGKGQYRLVAPGK